MLEQVRRSLLRETDLPAGSELWIGVSGGVDSMVLLHVLRTLGYRCHVVHVDHGLRAAESEADAAFVKAQCDALQLPVVLHKVDVGARKMASDESTQMAARQLRYTAFQECLESGPNVLALAHHADDAVETFFINAMRGMGAKGWKTIAFRSGAFIRPLLHLRRQDIEAYAEQHAIAYREDASNSDTKYLRNRVRHELIPKLEEMRPGTTKVMTRNVELLREMDAVVQVQLDRLLKDIGPDADGTQRISIPHILGSGMPLLMLLRLLEQSGLHPDRMDDILLAMEQGATGASFPAQHSTVFVDRSTLVIVPNREPERTWSIKTWDAVPEDCPLRITSCAAQEIDLSKGADVAWLDADALRFPLILRPWQAGDRIRPIGMNGSKLVSDLLIDAKVPMDRKAKSYVLADGERILWVCGMRIAEGAQAHPGSNEVLRCAWSRLG